MEDFNGVLGSGYYNQVRLLPLYLEITLLAWPLPGPHTDQVDSGPLPACEMLPPAVSLLLFSIFLLSIIQFLSKAPSHSRLSRRHLLVASGFTLLSYPPRSGPTSELSSSSKPLEPMPARVPSTCPSLTPLFCHVLVPGPSIASNTWDR